MPILRVLSIVAMIYSATLGARVLIASSTGVSNVIMAIITVVILTVGLCVFAEITCLSFKAKKYGFSALAGAIVVVLYALSVSGQAVSWTIEHRKETSKLEMLQNALAAKNADVASAEQQLSRCNPLHVTKCVNPATEILATKQAERDIAAAELAKLSDAAGVDAAWSDVSEWIGAKEKNKNSEFNRDIALALIVDLLAIFFYANPTIVKDLTDFLENKEKPTVQQLRIDSPQPDIIPTQPPVEYQPQTEYQPPVVANPFDWNGGFSRKQNDIVDFIMTLPAGRNIAITGQQGYGKSSLLGHLAQYALKAGHAVYVIDPHFNITESSFDSNCKIIGKGKNYAEIKEFFNWLENEMNTRAMQLATIPNIENSWQPITILMDEMTATVEKIGRTKGFITFYTEMRKYKGNFLGISHSFDVNSMGVSGKKSVLNSFDLFELSDKNNGYLINHLAVLTNGKRELKQTFEHPGPITFSHIPAESKQPNFKPVIDSIVNVSPKVLKKNLNSDIFS